MLRIHLQTGGEPKVVEVAGDRFVIGREAGVVDLVVDDEEISREHAALRELPDGRLEIEDLGSRNGTFVDGNRLTGPVTLSGGEEIKVGATMITVEQPRASETTATPVADTPAEPVPPPGEPTVVGTPPPLPPSPTPTPPPSATPPAAPPPTPPPTSPPTPPPAAPTPPPTPPTAPIPAPPPTAAPTPPPAVPAPGAARPAPQPAAAAPAPAGFKPAPAKKKRGVGRIIALIVSLLLMLAVAGAVVFVIISGGTSQALHKAGIGGGWDDAYVDERQQACESTGASADACGCFVDELQNDFSQDQYEEVVTQVESGVESEDVTKRAEIAADCGVTL